MSSGSFEDLSGVYEAIVDWPKRLSREAPFYRSLFTSHQVQTILDVACGSGHHAAMFQRWGLTVTGSDVSSAMIQTARQVHGEPAGLRWQVRSFAEPYPDEAVDAAICIGNSLALASDFATAQTATRRLLQAVHPGGLVVVQLANLWALPDGPGKWQKCQRVRHDGQEAIAIKGIQRCGSRGFVNFLVASPSEPERWTSQAIPLLGITAQQLTCWLQDEGARSVERWGSYERTHYDPPTSTDLLVVAQRR